MSSIYFSALRGPMRGQQFIVKYDTDVSIGRSGSSILCIAEDDCVSRNHARIVNTEAGVIIEDVGSKNGTFVDGNRLVTKQVLKPGSTITLGTTILRFEKFMADA